MAAWISRRYRGKNAFILLVLIRLEIDVKKRYIFNIWKHLKKMKIKYLKKENRGNYYGIRSNVNEF
jgi:hypothetical protein